MIRNAIWKFFTRNHPKQQILSKPLIFCKSLMWPLEYINYKLKRASGYQYLTNTFRVGNREIHVGDLLSLKDGDLVLISINQGKIYLDPSNEFSYKNWWSVIDNALVCSHLGVADPKATVGEATEQLNRLIAWEVDLAEYNRGHKL